MRWLRSPAAVFGVALGLRLLVMLVLQTPEEVLELRSKAANSARFDGPAWIWGCEQGSLAAALARGDGFSDPFGFGTGPSAWQAPLYPALVAACMALFGGVTPAAAAVLYTVQALFSSATAALLVLLGRRLAIERAGRLAAWLWALHPMSIWYAVNKLWDMELVATCVAAFVVLLFHVGRGPRLARAAGLGALFGVLVLVNPAVVALFPVVLLYLAPLPVQRALATAGACAAGAFLVCLPWSLRNWLVLGSPGIRSNLGVELYVGNNDLADGQHRTEYHPGWTASETDDLLALGEVAYSADRGRRARDWIEEHPGRFLGLCATRARIFWLGEIPTQDRRTFYGKTSAQDPKNWVRWVVHLATGVLGVLGTVALVRRKRSPEVLFIACALVLFPLAYYVVHVLERYRFPIEPLLLLAAAWQLLRCWEGAPWHRGHRRATMGPDER